MTHRNAIIKMLRAGAKASHFQKSESGSSGMHLSDRIRPLGTTADKPKAFQATLAVIMQDVRRSQISANNIGIFRPVTGRRCATTSRPRRDQGKAGG
jgi:hypothetical protein